MGFTFIHSCSAFKGSSPAHNVLWPHAASATEYKDVFSLFYCFFRFDGVQLWTEIHARVGGDGMVMALVTQHKTLDDSRTVECPET